MLRLAIAILLLLAPSLAHADVSGPATVIDGDTLDVAGERVRLYGIDAPGGCLSPFIPTPFFSRDPVGLATAHSGSR